MPMFGQKGPREGLFPSRRPSNPLARKGPLGGPDEGRPSLQRGRIAPNRKAQRVVSEDPARMYLLKGQRLDRHELNRLFPGMRKPKPGPYFPKRKPPGPVLLASASSRRLVPEKRREHKSGRVRRQKLRERKEAERN